MIEQYSWASVKKQQRKHIEFGMMITLVLATVTFYAVPQFGTTTPVVEEYLPPLIQGYEIPPAITQPKRVEPARPSVIQPDVEAPDIDIDIPFELPPGMVGFMPLSPPAVPDPVVPIWTVEIPPAPLGGYATILANITYPEIAREAGIEGRVIVEALIGIDGYVKEITVLEGIPRTGLDEAAMEAIWLTRFSPAYQRDKPVSVRMAIPIVFTLK